jgi:cysteine desulfurase
MSGAVYLDYNATAPVRPEVVRGMVDRLAEPGNPSSVHNFGRAARAAIDQARVRVAALVGATPGRVVFTSGGTEANNLALHGSDVGRRLVSAVEHVSVGDAAAACAGGSEVVPVDAEGRVDAAALDALLSAGDGPGLLCVMAANNETGVIQPVAELAARAREAGLRVHCDAVQAAGRMALDMKALGVDSLALSAHKIGGPTGVGALVLGEGAEPEPLIVGGGQERGLRAGTENVTGIVGFGIAAELACAELERMAEVAALRDSVEHRLRAVCSELAIFGAGAPRLANTSCLAMPGLANETQIMAFDLEGIALSAGSACSSGKVGPSHVLAAMGIAPELADEAIRMSLGWASTQADTDRFVDVWRALYARAQGRRPAA